MKKNGFTLVEMMAVIALVGLLAVIGVATYTRVNESAKQKTLEAKKEQIRSSAMKWAKENSVTNKTVISVNALVVEGYLTADENRVDQIGLIENPVTGDNMICNTVDISFKEGEMVAEVNDTIQNCDLATQSLVDTKIDIRVIDADGHNKTGGTNSSMSSWTNRNVIVVVSSTEYDRDAVSISFDFEGNTETKMISGLSKYTGTSYLNSDQAKLYYNVFKVDANLLLNTKVVVSYTLTNGSVKSRAYTIRIDKEEATASIKANNEWLTVDKPVYVDIDDGKGSGPKYFYVTKTDNPDDVKESNRYPAGYESKIDSLEVGKYYIWTEDNAGNRSVKPKLIFELNNVDKTVPECEVVFHGHEGSHGWYKEVPVTPAGKNSIPAGISGMNLGVNTDINTPVYTAFASYNTYNEGTGETRTTETTRSGVDYYCHVKTLAGNYANNKRNLKLDMTPPTVNIDVTSDTNYTQIKQVKMTVSDSLSGLYNGDDIRFDYAWSLGPETPSGWSTSVSANSSTEFSHTFYIFGGVEGKMTGKYYLWIRLVQVHDVAGNNATGINGQGRTAMFGPYYFDNTPPQCTSNNGKTNWTTGSYNIRQYCGDAEGTTDQSGCTQGSWLIPYTSVNNVWSDAVTISDNAGNTQSCSYNVYLDNNLPTCGRNNGKSNWTNGSWTGNQYCSDGYSGCSQNPFSRTWTSSTNQSSITISDTVGHTKSCSISVRLDTAAPTCTTTSTQAEGSWTNGTVTLTGNCHDTGGSGCLRATTFPASFSDQQASSQTPGKVADNAGNEADCPYFTVRIDKTLPVCSVSKSNTGSTSGVNTSISASDAGGSGLNTGASSSGESGVKSNRTYTVYDYAGNSNTCSVSVESYACNCYTHYGSWSAFGSCFQGGAPTTGSDTWECTNCTTSDSKAGYKCRSRSKWWACDDTCYR